MTAAGNKVQDHYASEGIAARILAALRAAGGSEAGPITPDALAPLDHFHGQLKATKEMVALLEPSPASASPRHRRRDRRTGAVDRDALRLPRDLARPDAGVLPRGGGAECRDRPLGSRARGGGQRDRSALRGRWVRPEPIPRTWR